MRSRHAGSGKWPRARRVLYDVLTREVGVVRDIGWLAKLGDGLSREVFGAEVEFEGGKVDSFVVALPRPDADPELAVRTHREHRLIGTLGACDLPFDLPEVVGVALDEGQAVLVRRFVAGVPLDLRAGRQPGFEPWEVVGEIAAAVHAIPGAVFTDVLDGPATRDAHAREAMAAFDGHGEPELRDAHDWAAAHLPPPEPSVLVHGDLLGQNILLEPGRRPTVIDWEYARRGDPAYDLAIVTRGAGRPFHTHDGLERLLEAYRRHGGRDVSPAHVRVHELFLLARWYRDRLAERGAASAQHELGPVTSLLRRLQ